MLGTWMNIFVSEIIIKRRHNLVVIAGLVKSTVPRKVCFLKGYSEEMLAIFLKRPVKLELQIVDDKKDCIFKYI